jgi:aryl-alcohol dehydrogenase-like predicted oxidoreductase
MVNSKLTLGTAQLGLNYGIANTNGKPDFKTSIKILKYSWDHGINTFDTAPSYGNSEEIIGEFISSVLNDNIENLTIISKMPPIKSRAKMPFYDLYDYIRKQIIQSLNNLNIESIPIYLLHHAPDLFLNNGIVVECLNQLRNEGLINRIGISVYNPDEAEASMDFKQIDIIQVPINIFDHRLIKTGLLRKLKSKKYIIFARSIYLQGLFFITPEKLPKYLESAKKPLFKLKNLINEFNIDIAKLALLFVRDIPEIDSMVIGAEKIDQVAKNLEILNELPLTHEINKVIFEEFTDISEKIINPSLWNK